MPSEPVVKRTIAFFDGQNLFHAAKEAFGYSYPNFDPRKLAEGICQRAGWSLSEVRFYTGVPNQTASPAWREFWSRKLAIMGTRGIRT